MATAYVALGSNIGDRWSHLRHALGRLRDLSPALRGSPVYETAPVGGPAGQGSYLNAVVEIQTDLAPRVLLDALLGIEQEQGRIREERWGPRTLDLDLLWYDGATIKEQGLSVPHPEIRNRQFVLAPLVDLAPWLADDTGPFATSFDATGSEDMARVSAATEIAAASRPTSTCANLASGQCRLVAIGRGRSAPSSD